VCKKKISPEKIEQKGKEGLFVKPRFSAKPKIKIFIGQVNAIQIRNWKILVNGNQCRMNLLKIM